MRRLLLVSALLVCFTANAAGPETVFKKTSAVSSAAWFAANWFKAQSSSEPKQEVAHVAKVDKPVQQDISESDIEMKEYISSCLELTHNLNLCKQNWNEAKLMGGELVLSPVDRGGQVRKTARVEVTKVTKVEVRKHQPKEMKLLDVDNEEYKARRADVLSKPNAVVIRETYY